MCNQTHEGEKQTATKQKKVWAWNSGKICVEMYVKVFNSFVTFVVCFIFLIYSFCFIINYGWVKQLHVATTAHLKMAKHGAWEPTSEYILREIQRYAVTHHSP